MTARGDLATIAALTAVALSAAACGREESTLFVDKSTVAAAPVIPNQNYVGRWAATAEHCARQPWTFQATSVTTGDGTLCAIADAERSPAGYSLSGSCQIPSGELPGRLLLTFAGVDSMTLTGGPYKQPVTLVRCAANG